ncbi:hypothetical protein D8674_006416 [Pyrus ussuriensis x Pyrus communis]|uniref:Uncharacterized protein n=1 Tax=Pyrus ussuriensis x Pyrus communis TaxID=2448454 RepID=A0A5N5FUC5_9ROSA|nr:hypothetical protein D8674_006416 [Pyrus ussuriensis x Pyrus communis]
MPALVKFGCSFNSGDKFPLFPPPNGLEEGRTVAACGTVVDGAWSIGTFT